MPGTSMSGYTQSFDTAYPNNPWAGLDRNQRQWYDPILQPIYRALNVFGQFTTFQINNGDVNAQTMTLSGLYDLHANTDPVGFRQTWLPAAHVDSWQVDVTFSAYANKVAYHKFDKIVNYWRLNKSMNADTLRAISNDKLGLNIVDTMDMLSRNSLLNLPYKQYGPDFDLTDFSSITPSSTMRTDSLDQIHLGMATRDVPYAQNPSGNIGSVFCITSPGVIFDLTHQSDPKDWLLRQAYAAPDKLINNEIGTFRNVRFVVSPKCVLWNCGTVTYQTTVSAAIHAGDGAPSGLVDSTRRVGQAAATHYIQLAGGTDMTQFNVGDHVTLHTLRTSANGVTNGVDYTDGTIHNLRIVSKDANNHRLVFAKPIMVPFDTDLGAGVFAYVTKGVHIHASIFIGAPNVVAVGVGRPLELNYPLPVDDRNSIYRVSWEIYAGWQNYNPEAGEVVFTSGATRTTGKMLQ